MPAFRNAAPKPFSKEIITKGYGFHTPQDGSVCKIRVITDPMNIISDTDGSGEKEIIVGDVDEPIDRIIEDCIRTMKEEEECMLKFEHPYHSPDILIPSDSAGDNKNSENPTPMTDSGDTDGGSAPVDSSQMDASSESVENGNNIAAEVDGPESNVESESMVNNAPVAEPEEVVPVESKDPTEFDAKDESLVEIQFLLVSYTREPEIWEMSVTEKWRRASYHKQKGLELYSRGAYQYAFRRFGLTLKYVISLEHDIPSGQEEGMDIKGLKLSCYLNVAACQMRHYNFESVVINATKALELQPSNAKALYRRGAAHLQLQEFEKAKVDLSSAQELEPKNQAVAKQLQILKCQVQKLNQYYASAMKKLFS